MITTPRLILRPYRLDDWERVHAYASIPEFSKLEAWGPNSVADTKAYLAKCISEIFEDPVTRYQLALALRENGLLIGGCTLNKPAADANEAFLGYAVNPAYQRQGYATEATIALIRFGFDQLHLSRIFATCDTRNLASWRVMEKAGLRRIKLIHNDRLRKGVMTDSYHYEILRQNVS